MIEMAQVPGFYRRRFGDVVVTALNDGVLEMPHEWIQGLDGEAVAALQHEAFRPRVPRSSVNAFLIQGNGRTVLIDTGAGGSMGPTLGRLPANLMAAGVAPGEVDLVLVTHLHPDHSGGLASEAGTALFPRAELGVPKAEAGFWLNEAVAAAAPDEKKPYFAGAQASVSPYRARLRVFDGTDVAPGIQAIALPGHTPGHTGYIVGTGDSTLLIWADAIHVPDVQARHPDIGMMFDVDPDDAIVSRRRVLDMAAQDRLMVAGMHLHFPAFSHVARMADGYALVPDAWSGGL